MIELADVGSFFVGGRQIEIDGEPIERIELSTDAIYDRDPNGTYWIESAYVQYFLPKTPCQSTPLLLVHGGGCTGAVWESTPDGRTGWLNLLLEANFPVYVMDNVERGRSGFCWIDGVWEGKPIVRSEEEAWTMYRFGRLGAAGERIAFPGQQFPIEAMPALSAQTVPRWTTTSPLHVAALRAAITKIGPVVLIAHSQGGGFSMHAMDEDRKSVCGAVLLEPHGIPLAYDNGIPGTPILFVVGDFIGQHAYWTEMQAKYAQSASAWTGAGGHAEVLSLPARGISGNTHMLMMDRNSDRVLEAIIDWLDGQRSAGAFS